MPPAGAPDLTVACAVAAMCLMDGGVRVATRERLTALARGPCDPRGAAARIAEQLRTWRP
ncbi:hypothetical protein ACIHCQ_32410 [Streptomyces sp. NPDC052236]|uniref:hypothetical protein n=1 Tax=Streptomyces sp. NPDC052236 TaxID=3365686 RepID=UPI0037D821ED